MSTTEMEDRFSQMIGRNEEGPYLKGGRCISCQAVFFPRQSVCPRCTGQEITDAALSRKGRLYTYTEVFQKPPDYDGPVPYMIGRVLLPDGVFVLAQLDAPKEELRIDLEMELLVESIYRDEDGGDVWAYKFRPAGLRPKGD
jgi:uncharacterized OB-fold protein